MRPAVLQIFRAAGFHNTSSAVLDVATDLTLRYLMLLAAKTAHYAANNHEPNLKNYQRDETSSGSSTGSNSDRADSHDYDYDYDYTGEAITIQDVRMAMMDLGALRPQMSILEERARKPVSIDGVWGDESSEQLRKVPYEDMRGTNAFLKWAKGPINQEIRRIAGLATVASNIGGTAAAAGRGVIGAAPSSGAADAMEVGIALDKNEDYLTGKGCVFYSAPFLLFSKHISFSSSSCSYCGDCMSHPTNLNPLLLNLLTWTLASPEKEAR